MDPTQFGSLDPSELDALAGIQSWAFGFGVADARAWLERADRAHVRVARRGGRVVGGLIEIPMGQWFGGKSVANLGLAGVAVAPDARGGNVARDLVITTLRAARESGVAVSTLYPATIALYRAAGYELAGSRFRWTLVSTKLPRSEIQVPVTLLGAGDAPAVEALYREVASARNGYLDRGPYVWQRVRDPRGGETRGYAVRNGSSLEGYVYLQQRGPEDQRQLVVTDLVAVTPEALRRLLRLVADHQSTLKTTLFHGAAHEPLLFALSESAGRVELTDHFMLRIVDVEKALSTRGYRAVDARVDFEIADQQIPENSGNFRLEVERGTPRVTRGGVGTVGLDVRGLAALYTGFLPPADLARAGMLRANERDLSTLSDLFGGSSPAMSDFF